MVNTFQINVHTPMIFHNILESQLSNMVCTTI